MTAANGNGHNPPPAEVTPGMHVAFGLPMTVNVSRQTSPQGVIVVLRVEHTSGTSMFGLSEEMAKGVAAGLLQAATGLVLPGG